MKNNIKIIMFLVLSVCLLNIDTLEAAYTQHNFSVTLFGTSAKSTGYIICNVDMPAVYTVSADHETKIAIMGEDGEISNYYVVKQGTTFTFTKPSSIVGGNKLIKIYAKSSSFHLSNNYKGIALI